MKALLDLAFDAYDAGDPDRAAEICHDILRQEPDHFGANYLLGSLCAEQDDLAGALKYLGLAAQHDKTEKGLAQFNLALIQVQSSNFDAADKTVGAFLTRFPTDVAALLLQSEIALQTNVPSRAVEACERALQIEPDNPDIVANFALSLHKTHKTDLARAACQRALQLDPARAETYLLKSSLDYEQLDFAGAIDAASKAAARNPDFHDALYMRGIMKLLVHDYETGWSDYEHRLDASWVKAQSFKLQSQYLDICTRHPTKAMLRDKRVLLIEEQGLGDTLMFASMFSDLAACASHIEAYVDPRLLSLMQYSFPAIRFHSLHNLAHLEQTHFDHLLFMGSLGHAFRRSALDFSGAPYLKIPDAVSAKWRSTLANLPGKKIGIGWRGGTTTTNEAGRNLPLDQLQLLLEDERFSFVTLQHDAKPDEIEWLQRMSGNRLTVIQSQDVEDMVQLGGLIQALDDVVTTQNTNVHLAGALGSSCKAIMPVVPTWSYGAQGSAMNWYRAVKLYRRSANEPLATLIARLCRDII